MKDNQKNKELPLAVENFGSRRDFLCLPKYHRQPIKEEVYVHDTM